MVFTQILAGEALRVLLLFWKNLGTGLPKVTFSEVVLPNGWLW